jgi:type IV secretion system protein VirB1
MVDFLSLAAHCAPQVHPETMASIVKVESSFNPFAIGVVGGQLKRQPRTKSEAVSTARWLWQNGYNFSVGLAQVNISNFKRFGLTLETAFDTCQNLAVGGSILAECFSRARAKGIPEQKAVRAAFSCYYSGNFSTGFKTGYVAKVVDVSLDSSR